MRSTTLLIGLLSACLIIISPTASAAKSPQDSLLTVLSATKDPVQQMHLYRDLADINYENTASIPFLIKLVDQAKELDSNEQMMEALSDLSVTYMLDNKLDSARYYITLAEQYAPRRDQDRWCCYMNMRFFNAELISSEKNIAELALDEKIANFQKEDTSEKSIYVQIMTEYNIGLALLDRKRYKESLPYMLKSLELSATLPLREGNFYRLWIMRLTAMTYDYLGEMEKSIEITKQSAELKDQCAQLYKKERHFYPTRIFYIRNYTARLIYSSLISDEEAEIYLAKLKDLCQNSTDLSEKYNYYLALTNYALSRNDLRKGLVYNDSLIRFGHDHTPYNLPGLYLVHSQIYEALGEPENALKWMRESHKLQDSLQQTQMQEKLNHLRVEYDVDRLKYEKSQLEVRNKRIMIIGLSVLLGLLISICIYLYIHLKQERVMKKQMEELKLQAEESENIKTSFINSICHEIRTPLNGIVGFAELMLDPSMEEEMKSSFSIEIQQNTNQLVTLIDSMLEVSNLDVSTRALPCETTDIAQLCRNKFERFGEQPHKGITSSVELPNEPLLINTNQRYLSLVVEQLLNNAYKFTEQGHVTLRCERKGNAAVISIEDTGCGIPADKHEVVFERFTKLNTYKPGSGLGLYLCLLIIRRLSGQIFIDPQYTGGTRIVVVLDKK